MFTLTSVNKKNQATETNMWSEFASANRHSKSTIMKRAHNPLRTSRISQTNVSALFDHQKILLIWLKNKQTFHMLSLLDLRFFFFCSCDLDILRAEKDHGLLNFTSYPQTNVVNVITWLGIGCHTHFIGENVFYEKH